MEGEQDVCTARGLTGPDTGDASYLDIWIISIFGLLGSTRKQPAFLNVPDAVSALPTPLALTWKIGFWE